uniref:RING-type domain-containing protein n=1 Tax=Pelusios castaneus TaxID=367368 RepID=A0A8C8RJN7_9SAUR
MAATNPAKTLQDETSCPICLEYFKDLVVLDCDHNFCRACITQCWEGSQTLSCPRCRQTCPEKNLRPNRQLRNIVEAARVLRLTWTKGLRTGRFRPHTTGVRRGCNKTNPWVVLSCVR